MHLFDASVRKQAREHLLTHYTDALVDGRASLFVGAGLSAPAGLPTWPDLLAPVSPALGLSPSDVADLTAFAQWAVNSTGGDRSMINAEITRAFGSATTPTPTQLRVARLPAASFWTPNYDRLLERALDAAGKPVVVRAEERDFARPLRAGGVELLKMHGTVDHPDGCVLTADDYAAYALRRGLFLDHLRVQLVSHSFLFLGFGLTDPNVLRVLAETRARHGSNKAPHFWVERVNPKWSNTERLVFQHRAFALQRLGVTPFLIDDYSELDTLLADLDRRVVRHNVVVSGSFHAAEGALDAPALTTLCRKLGGALVASGRNVVTGLGLGVGAPVFEGAWEALPLDPRGDPRDRVRTYRFPQERTDPAQRAALWEQLRQRFVPSGGAAIFIAGNKLVNGTVVPADGVHREFDIAHAHKRLVLPIGVTGSVARTLWQQVSSDLATYWPSLDPALHTHFLALGTETDPDTLVKHVLTLLDATLGRASP